MGSSSRINSRIYTNSFTGKNNETYAPFHSLEAGNSFYGLSRPQYSRQTYYQLADNGAGAGSRGDRWLRSQNQPPVSFIPPMRI